MMNKISLITLGCKMNQAETQAIADKLSGNFEITFEEKDGESDIYILNTCSVTSEAERKSRQIIRRIKRLNKNSKIIAVGCYAVSNPYQLREAGADLVLGNHEKKNIHTFLDKIGVFSDYYFWRSDNNYEILLPKEPYGDRTRVFLPIEEGCINSCAFCKIRFLRGLKIISLPKEEVLKSIRTFIAKGYKEIVLTGTNLGYYGFNKEDKLSDLLKDIGETFSDENIRIRLTSLYPEDINIELSNILNAYPIFEKHAHISIQHFSDRVLKLMKRNYSRKMIYNSIENLRKNDPKFSITCDLIVGFPGENDDDLRIMLDSIKNLDILKVHGFRYSVREGTLAAKMDKQIPEKEKKNRLNNLREISKISKFNYLNKMINSMTTVLVEQSLNKRFFGYDEYYIPHNIAYENSEIEKGIFIQTKISSVSEENKGVVSHVF